MSNERDDAKTALYEKLLIAFREAKAHGLSRRDCEAAAEQVNGEVFPEGGPWEPQRDRAR